ncbi:flagellar biosynthesis protein FlgN [Erwinia sp. OLTSP20]|uniref:flagellar export chaperone FlgN n=1 Tax=unclassified Erwinia TaxID=2622719 RepID=UPI000C1A32D9|nr:MULTISPECIES: flagellar export chaperone FlgN [unclassified Erwinia]PIJ51916.1 flagellar biosynthesis protein FlgN [Erwinia sp. OAMSP11]PIJ74791.1 flagellar biosynthesis protein FlgN [Erwinia sp. OLSSP12]PIJ85177.1 flagellar biosynthesis protein FlgN [Erwinia sp. OLCASP19]PIJ87178.1 flagellar biosynthesis protein FlgN [Erwinia sp. OLMTSP26]PIJ88322.1 flagellar biosynthesis protein FlgN [Erwinia sp. OLMDSP33]
MNMLLSSLDKMLEVLASLSDIMDAEQQQLSAGQVNSNLLQRITEDKSALLATLNYIEQMRREASEKSGLHAPYSDQPQLAQRWSLIQQSSIRLRDKNQHNALLLNHQMAHTEQMLNALRPLQSQQFYGPDGQATGQRFFSHKD